ncbi:MAG TPA: type II toxin-antitoxin system HicA family toxin, partial [bacterium]|nr:type II toxin-antitoxin system HicA family toxin [bacterium]
MRRIELYFHSRYESCDYLLIHSRLPLVTEGLPGKAGEAGKDGKHQFMIKGKKKIRIPNPHGSKNTHISLLKEILRQAGIKNDEW